MKQTTMLRKTLMFSVLLAIAVSPILPSARAHTGNGDALISEASWNYGTYTVERLATFSDMQGPFELGNTVFFTQPAKSCTSTVCENVDVTIFLDGKTYVVTDVNHAITQKAWRTAQDDRFIMRTPSTDAKNWFVVSEFHPETKAFTKRLEPVKQSDELSFMTLATDGTRVYTSMLHTDKTTSAIESKLSVFDYASGYERRDFTFTLSAPWQEILDVQDDNVLTKFHFDDGSKQLIIINERARTAIAVDKSWGAANEPIEAAHFLKNGSVQFFKSYRLFTYDAVEKTSSESGGAYLNWFMRPDDAYHISNGRMAWINDQDILYVSDVNGVSNYGKVVNKEFALTEKQVYFHGLTGYVGFDFDTHTWTDESFLIVDQKDDIQIGVDDDRNIWYKNATNGRVLNVGFGSNPILTERDRIVFRGDDHNIYHVTLSEVLDLRPSKLQAFKASDASDVYLVSDNKIWNMPDEKTFFTWFDSYEDVTVVSATTMAAYKRMYEPAGMANYAPGTRVKSTASARVYVVGQDGGLHWITSETVANSIWGTRWNKGIMVVQPETIWDYQIGSDLRSSQEMKTI